MEIYLQIITLALMIVFIFIAFYRSMKYDHSIQLYNENTKKLVIQIESKRGDKEYHEIDLCPLKEYWLGNNFREDIKIRGVGRKRFELCLIPGVNDSKLVLTKGCLKIRGFEYHPNIEKQIIVKNGTPCLLGGESYAVELYVI